MFRVTGHHTLHIPHRVALLAGLIALSTWTWNHHGHHAHEQSLAAHEELSNTAVKESQRALLDLGILLLLKGTQK